LGNPIKTERLRDIYRAAYDFPARHLEEGVTWAGAREEMVKSILDADADPFCFLLMAAVYKGLEREVID